MTAWSAKVWKSPLLRGLDERGRDELTAAGELRRLRDGDRIHDQGERGYVLHVVAEGAVRLIARRRGEDLARELRRVEVGDSFGEEATIGASYRSTAKAAGDCVVVALPVALLRRALVRAGGNDVADRFERRARRTAIAELLSTSSLGTRLPRGELELMLDRAEQHELARGEAVYRCGEPASHLWLVADGMVQLQSEDNERLRVRAYLTRGDFFGDEELLSGERRQQSAVASGDSLLVSIPIDVARTVADRNPGLLRGIRRVAREQQAVQLDLMAGNTQTQHAFQDLYRLQVARSLLVIDLDSCVRCGHCAWSCESLHGVSRLVRRGDKIITPLMQSAEAPSPLLLPNSCQHCENPACMPDCPTGAIGRDPNGEVFIRDELCTGCGACAKGCPWDNIQIVPRPADVPAPDGGPFADLAVKCDLCRDYDGPACVKACPTEAIMRINPAEDLPEVAAALGGLRRDGVQRRTSFGPWLVGATLVAVAIAVAGATQHASGAWHPRVGAAWWMGVAAALGYLGLLAYAAPKRLVRVWSRPRATEDVPTRSLVKPQLLLHLVLGVLATGAAIAHGGWRVIPTSGGAALLGMIAASGLGVFGALAYAGLPRRLSRIEREAHLPEDYASVRRELADRLYERVTGRSELVKKLFEKVLVAYLKSPLGWVLLLISGRSAAEERAAIRGRIDTMLQGRGAERLAGLDELIRLAVELRSLTAQRVLTVTLRAWLPLHIVAAAVTAALLGIHVVGALSS